MTRIPMLLLCLLLVAAGKDERPWSAYEPGFFRLATKSAFMGRIRIDASTAPVDAESSCGSVHEATVIDSISGSAAGEKIRFVASEKPGTWPAGDDYFALLFRHALSESDPKNECWVKGAPLFAAVTPASVVPFDRRAAELLGGEFLAVNEKNVLAGLYFSSIEAWIDGKSFHFASWDLIKSYARQTPAARRAYPTLPDDLLRGPEAAK